MPRTLGGLVGFVVTAVISVAIGLAVIQRVAPLRALVYGKAA